MTKHGGTWRNLMAMFGGVVFQDDTACWIEGNLNTTLRDVTSFIPEKLACLRQLNFNGCHEVS